MKTAFGRRAAGIRRTNRATSRPLRSNPSVSRSWSRHTEVVATLGQSPHGIVDEPRVIHLVAPCLPREPPAVRRATSSFCRVRIWLVLREHHQPRRPTSASHSASLAAVAKRSSWTSTLHPARPRASATATLPRARSTKNVGGSGRGRERELAADRFLDLLFGLIVVSGEFGDRLTRLVAICDHERRGFPCRPGPAVRTGPRGRS